MKPSGVRACERTLGLALACAAGGCLTETRRDEVTPGPSLARVATLDGDAPPSCDGVVGAEAVSSIGETPGGWASVEGDGLSGTTGGAAGEVVLVRTLDELISMAASDEPLVIQFCGAIGTGLEQVDVGSNKTLMGVGTRPTLRLSLELDDVQNVILRDFYVAGSAPDRDGTSLRRSHHVWIDHVDFSDGADGNLDITDRSNYVTVSYTRFWYENPTRGHRFSNLIGSSDNRPQDAGTLKVTMHHNWWADNVHERMPRARFGEVHVYNNYYTALGNNYCIRSGFEASVLVEGNFFRSVSDPMVLDQTGRILHRDNVFESARGRRSTTDSAFEPPYPYVMDAPESIPEIVEAWAGPGRRRPADG